MWLSCAFSQSSKPAHDPQRWIELNEGFRSLQFLRAVERRRREARALNSKVGNALRAVVLHPHSTRPHASHGVPRSPDFGVLHMTIDDISLNLLAL